MGSDAQLGRRLAWVLRHGADRVAGRLSVSACGLARLEELARFLKVPQEAVQRVVAHSTGRVGPRFELTHFGEEIWVGGLQEGQRVGTNLVVTYVQDYIYADQAEVDEHSERVDRLLPWPCPEGITRCSWPQPGPRAKPRGGHSTPHHITSQQAEARESEMRRY